MIDIVYLNGKYIAKNNAKISVLDRGFLFADGIYEVIPVYNATPFRLSEHLERLQYSLSKLEIINPHSNAQWQQIINNVIKQNGGGNQSLYLHITRGVDTQREHVIEKQTQPTILLMSSPLVVAKQPIKTSSATLLADIRWQFCDIKSVALLGNMLLRNEAQQRGHDEAILHRDQIITEGSSSNVFIVKNNEIYTPCQNNYILGGITREVIIEISQKSGFTVHQQDITVTELLNADEVWISSSSREISPVTHIDGKIIGDGNIGALAKTVHGEFQSFKKQLCC